jgi:crossover junction endodeoxyribonuclease RuvC
LKKNYGDDSLLQGTSSELPKTECISACSLGSLTFKREAKNNADLTPQRKSSQKRRILGIDPGLASTGWGVIDEVGSRIVHIAHGVIETTNQVEHQVRLLEIYNHILNILREYKPDEASMEALYFAKNVTSGLAVAESRGVITLCLAQNAVPLSEYSPLSIKQCVVGSARAEKKHVQQYVKILLGLTQIPNPNHAADALAVAITHTMNASTVLEFCR